MQIQSVTLHAGLHFFHFNLICNMTTFRKIYSLTFWPHPLGQGCVCGQNICYHVAASVVSFNLICNMTIFWKSLILASAPPPKSTQQTQTQAFKLKSCLICFKSIAALPKCKISANNFNNCLSYCEIKIFDLWPLRWGQRGWGKTLTLPCLSSGTWQSLSNSEKLLNIIALMKCEDHHTKKLV